MAQGLRVEGLEKNQVCCQVMRESVVGAVGEWVIEVLPALRPV